MADKGLKVFMYLNNDAFGYAPANAQEFMDLIRINRSGSLLKKPA